MLDVSCGTGATGVETALLGRHFVGCAKDPALVKLARARLSPADIAEVVLRLNIVSGEARLDLRTAQLEASDAVRLATAFRTAHMPPAENQWSPGDPDLPDNLAKTSFMPDS